MIPSDYVIGHPAVIQHALGQGRKNRRLPFGFGEKEQGDLSTQAINSSNPQVKCQAMAASRQAVITSPIVSRRKGETKMKTSKLFLLLIAFGCAGLMQAAEINDVFIAYNPGSPPDPTFDDNLKEWNWAAPWTPITLPQAEPMLLQPGQSIWLGLANEQRLEPWFKLVTLEFHTGGVVPIEYKAGFEDGTTITWGMDLVDSTITYRRWEGRIDPQPGWEWVRLYNQLDTETALRITNFTSVCVIPAPGAILLAAIGTGTVGCLRRRRVL